MGESAICDVDVNNSKEYLCNSVAAEFLVPSKDLLKNPLILNKSSKNWTNQELWKLSHEYGVSRQSLLLRLIHTNKASQKSYDLMKEQWMQERKNKGSKGGSPVLNQIKYNGKLYSSLVLSAFENGVISNVEFSQIIGLRLKHVDELSEKLFG
jgi:Zn-dependent peptidase ImmA (M78 family)